VSTQRHRCLSLTLATVLVAASCAPLGLVPSAALAAGTHTITAAASPTATAAASPTATAAASPTATAASSPTATAAAPTVTTNPLSGGISPLSPVPTTTTPTTVITNATTAAPGSSSISSASVIAIAVGAVIVLGGISVFIWRDARRRAPVATRPSRAGPSGDGRRAGSKPPAKPRKPSPAERRRRKRGRAR
jgi:hypothetical protein